MSMRSVSHHGFWTEDLRWATGLLWQRLDRCLTRSFQGLVAVRGGDVKNPLRSSWQALSPFWRILVRTGHCSAWLENTLKNKNKDLRSFVTEPWPKVYHRRGMAFLFARGWQSLQWRCMHTQALQSPRIEKGNIVRFAADTAEVFAIKKLLQTRTCLQQPWSKNGGCIPLCV